MQKLGLIKRTNGQLCFWALRSSPHSQSLYFLLSVTFPFNLYFLSLFHFSFCSLYRSLSLFLFLCSFPPISVMLELCHSSYITQQSSRARLVTTTNQLLPDPPPLVLVQTTTELCGQKTSCGCCIKAESITGGNANFLLI